MLKVRKVDRMKNKSKKESIKSVVGGIAAFTIFGSSYVDQLDKVKEILYNAYVYYLSIVADYICVPFEILNLIVLITLTYISLKIAEGSIKTLVLIGWALIIILAIAKIFFCFSLASLLPS